MFLAEGLRVHPGIGADRFAYLLTTRGTLLVRMTPPATVPIPCPNVRIGGDAKESDLDSTKCLHMATSRHLAASAAAR
jgi:hypothetical protein